MPYFDGTGPAGMGAITGRGMGPCGGNLGYERGYGRGMGLGRRFGRYYALQPMTPQRQVEDLTDYLNALKEEVKELEEYIKDLEQNK